VLNWAKPSKACAAGYHFFRALSTRAVPRGQLIVAEFEPALGLADDVGKIIF